MWSGPRNLSTALMYAFAARGDCETWDEPFYAAYLKATGLDHPMRGEILATHETNPDEVAARLIENAAAQHSYGKHMTHHMLPDFPRDWIDAHQNVFLIRHPARVVASYVEKREAPVLDDLGFRQQEELFDQVADRLGHSPPVIDSHSIRQGPKAALTRLCDRIGLPFTERMLLWPRGPKPLDGIWARLWYGAVHQSTGFAPPEGAMPKLSDDMQRLADAALPIYERLAHHEITLA
jgi:hypothetical protein